MPRLSVAPRPLAVAPGKAAQLPVADFENSNWHMFQLVLPERITRAAFMEKMMEKQVGIGYHYPAIHLLKLYRERGFKEGMFPVAERIGRLTVTLPMFYAMTMADVERTVLEDRLLAVFKHDHPLFEPLWMPLLEPIQVWARYLERGRL